MLSWPVVLEVCLKIAVPDSPWIWRYDARPPLNEPRQTPGSTGHHCHGKTYGWQNPAPLGGAPKLLKIIGPKTLFSGTLGGAGFFSTNSIDMCISIYCIYIYMYLYVCAKKHNIYIWIYSLSIHIIYDIVLIHKSFFATWVIQTRNSSRWFSVAWRTSRVVQLSASSLPMRTRFCGNRQDEHWNSIRREMGKL